MSKENLTPEELDGARYQQIIFDRDDDKLIKVDGGWVYEDLAGKAKPVPQPQCYPPYSTEPKGVQLHRTGQCTPRTTPTPKEAFK